MYFGGPGVVTSRVELQQVQPAVWRRFTIDTRATVPELHMALVAVMGWYGHHLHGFRVAHLHFGPNDTDLSSQIDETGLIVEQLLGREGAHLEWDYDFGDGWTHDLVVESVVALDYRSDRHVATCLDGANACPSEDCGGPCGYEDLLRILADPDDLQHSERLEWLGGPFDAEAFEHGVASAALLAIQ